MPIMFGAHTFYDLNSGPILALSHSSILKINLGMNCPIAHSTSAYYLKTTSFSQVKGKNVLVNIFKVSCLSIIVVMWLGNYVITKHNYSIKISSSKF